MSLLQKSNYEEYFCTLIPRETLDISQLNNVFVFFLNRQIEMLVVYKVNENNHFDSIGIVFALVVSIYLLV